MKAIVEVTPEEMIEIRGHVGLSKYAVLLHQGNGKSFIDTRRLNTHQGVCLDGETFRKLVNCCVGYFYPDVVELKVERQ